MNYLEEQTNGEAMINSIKNGDQPLPHVTQVSIAGTSSTEQHPLKDKSMCNKIAKDLWDALARHMLGSEYGEQDRKAAALIAEKTKVSKCKEKVVVSSDSEGSEADDFSELKKIAALLAKAFNRRKVKCYNCKKEGHFAKDCKKAKVKDYEYYKTKMLLAKKDKDEQVLLAEDQAWMESSSDSDQEINANMVFMAQIKKVLSDSEASSSSANEKISEEKYAKLEAEIYEYMIGYSSYFDNDKQHRKWIADQEVLYDKMSVQLVELDKHVRDLKNTMLEKDFKIYESEECVRNKDLEIKKCLERLNVCKNKLHKMGQTNQTIHMIMPSKDNLYNGRKRIGFENPGYFEKEKDLRPTLYDEKVIGLGYTPMFLTHSDEALEIEKFTRSRENKIEFAYDYRNLNASYIDSSFQQTSSLKPYVPNVILEKIITDLEDEVVSLLEKEKANLETIKSLKSKGVESSETVISESENQSENDCLVVEKEYDKEENPKVIAPGMFKLNVSQCISPISMSKSSCDSMNVEIKLKRKRRQMVQGLCAGVMTVGRGEECWMVREARKLGKRVYRGWREKL
nr:hypothetical protein [Tanacetum cinerariifolium]